MNKTSRTKSLFLILIHKTSRTKSLFYSKIMPSDFWLFDYCVNKTARPALTSKCLRI